MSLVCEAMRFFLSRFFLTIFVLQMISEGAAQHGAVPNEAELSVKKLQAAPGLSVELFASEPLLKNPVAFSVDERGRFFIAETHRYKDSIFDITRETNWLSADLSFRTVEDRAAFLKKEFATNLNHLTKDSELIRLVEDRDGDGRAETSSVFADGFNEVTSGTAAGILARKGEVWFTSIPDLWKFTESKGRARHSVRADIEPAKDGTQRNAAPYPEEEKVATGFGVHIGVSGHDLHGLALGPDGKIYFSIGDRGFSVRTKEGNFFDYPDTGGVLRCNQDGSDLEVFAIGLRNPQELAFDQFGNLFTADNDTAGEDNSRLIHVVEGGDYGWRASYQFMPGYGPWVQEKVWQGGIDGTLPHSGDSAQGPSGLAFYPGTGLPEKYDNHFFACDFPKGVWSFAVKPKGASYEITNKEKFLWNLGATDVDFGPDGAAYISDWGQSYSMPGWGRIYRVFDPAQKQIPVISEVKRFLAEGMESRSVEELVKLLGHADMRVRMEAQFQLVALGQGKLLSAQNRKELSESSILGSLRQIASESPNQLARVHAIWALGQLSSAVEKFNSNPSFSPLTGVLSNFALEPLLPLLNDEVDEIRAQAAKMLGDYSANLGGQPGKHAVENLKQLLLDSNPRVRFFAAMCLGELKDSTAVDPILEMLKRNADQDAYLVHAGVWALSNIGNFDAIQFAARNENASIRRAALLAMRRLERPEIAKFLSDPETTLAMEAARAINDVPINAAMPQLAAQLNSKTPVANLQSPSQLQIVRRAINANFRLGQKSNAVELATFAAKTNAPLAMRTEALYALSDWQNPHFLDRVIGLWRPLPRRERQDAQDSIRPYIKRLLNEPYGPVAVIECIRRLEMKGSSADLFEAFQNPDTTLEARIEVLRTLAFFGSTHLPKTVELAFASPDAALRREAIKAVALLSPEQTPLLLERLLATETDLRLSQTAFATLGTLTNSAATEVLLRQLDRLLAGEIAPELQLDLLDAAEKIPDSRVAEKIAAFKATFPKEDSLAEFRVALVGGDAARGKKLFNEREDLGCLRCHAIKGKGGNVGPDLGGIAKKQSREYLLESIVHPNKTIAAGYENILVTLKNGGVVAGLVKSETALELVLISPEDGLINLKQADVARRERGLSSMPEGIEAMLTRSELRDLLEFVAGLK